MKKLNIKLTGLNLKVRPFCLVDGKQVKLVEDKFGGFDATVETENSQVEVEVSRVLEHSGKLWWLYSILSFIVSLFGIFEPRYDKKCVAINCKLKVNLNETCELKLKFNPFSSSKACEIETQCEYIEISNEYYVDKTAKRRWRLSVVFKVIAWVAIIVAAVVLIAKAV